ncbi:MAG TPA: hypothetical protein VF857_11055, partial [Spirochaetota bacterium]
YTSAYVFLSYLPGYVVRMFWSGYSSAYVILSLSKDEPCTLKPSAVISHFVVMIKEKISKFLTAAGRMHILLSGI